MKQRTINVPFEMVYEDNQTGFAYVIHNLVSASCYAPSPERAATKLRSMLRDAIEEALCDTNAQRWAIGTKAGDIFLVLMQQGSWGYSILGPDRKHATGCWGMKDFAQTQERAREHAASGFGGISWEHPW